MFMHPQVVRHWMVIGTVALSSLCVATLAGIAYVTRKRLTTEEIEDRRRQKLAEAGRIVDGSLIDAAPLDSTPLVIIYSYRIAGVTYRCAQDVSKLGSLVGNLRLDYPVQVRYDRENPADSIVVAETWNGLWTNIWHPAARREGDRQRR